MNLSWSKVSCGVGELVGIYTFNLEKALYEACKNPLDRYGTKSVLGGIILYSDKEGSQHTNALTQYITSNNLGEVTTLPSVVNPVYKNVDGHKITLCAWTVDHRELNKWMATMEEKYNQPAKVDPIIPTPEFNKVAGYMKVSNNNRGNAPF
jgi:hypothetical protein